MNIRNRALSADSPAYIIAEIGMNHNGSLELARRHVEAAAIAKVDAVKFQTFRAEGLVANSDARTSVLKGLELPQEWHVELKAQSESLGLDFLSTPFDLASLELLEKLNLPALKVASCDLNNLPFLANLAKTGRPLLVSTGYSTKNEILEAVQLLKQYSSPFALLHCVSAYPTPLDAMNLSTLRMLAELSPDSVVGLSDHSTDDCVVPVAARALGACIFEKHFTVDKTLEGFDHAMSADPKEMERYVRAIRSCETALGRTRDGVYDLEHEKLLRARRSLYWNRDLKAGHTITEADLKIVRPAQGLMPKALTDLLGSKLAVDVSDDDLVKLEHVH